MERMNLQALAMLLALLQLRWAVAKARMRCPVECRQPKTEDVHGGDNLAPS